MFKKQKIRTNIIMIFLFLLALISFALIFTQFYFSRKLAVEATTKTFTLIGKNISQKILQNNHEIENILKANISNTHLKEKISFNSQHTAVTDLIQIMSIKQGVYSCYFTHPDGSFLEVINMSRYKGISHIQNIPKKTQWIVAVHMKEKVKYTFLSSLQKKISSIETTQAFTPFRRPWYKEAIESDDVVMTEPYLFHSVGEMGITFALKIDKKGSVFGIDYSLKTLDDFLSLQKFDGREEIFLFNKYGEKIASSRQNKKKVNSILLEAVITENSSVIEFETTTNNYLLKYIKIYKNLYLGIKVDSAVLFKPYNERLKYSLLISLLLVLLSIPIIYFATGIIVKPIRALIRENEDVKNRRFKKVEKIETNIVEFIELSDSLVSMSHSIYAYQKSQEELLNSIIKLIAEAVDAKSPYTGGHCERVPQIAQMLVQKASESNEGIFKEFSLESDDAKREFEIGAWLHDCGKVTTPEYVVNKSTKLETINDRIHEIRTRFEVLYRDAEITYLKAQLNGLDKQEALTTLKARKKQLIDDFAFVAKANIGGEFMSPEKQQRIKNIATQEWTRHFDDSLGLGEVEILRYSKENAHSLPAKEYLLSDKKQHIVKRENFDYEKYEREGFKEEVPEYLYNYGEVYNLCIEKGTLTSEERYKIDEHVIMTIKMLEKIPFPAQMTKIPEYAGTHHETLIGTGYPRKLTKEQLSIPSRIMAVADVFEALTASDRPYKKAKTLSESIKILSSMVKDEHLDADIFKLFLKSDLHNVYAKQFLKPEQIDAVDISEYF